MPRLLSVSMERAAALDACVSFLFLEPEGHLHACDLDDVAFVEFLLSADLLAVDLDLDLGLAGGDVVFEVALVDERGHAGGEEALEFDGLHIALADHAHLAREQIAAL